MKCLKREQIWTRFWFVLFAAWMVFAVQSKNTFVVNAKESPVSLEEQDFVKNEKTLKNISLDASALRPDGVWTLRDNKVYFGEYDGKPTAYRVLISQETQSVSVEKESLLLDCDTILTAKEFDADMKKNAGQTKRQNEWKGGDIEVWLNSSDFYGSSMIFSKAEKAAIAETSLAEDTEGYTFGEWTYADFGTTDHVFLLSAAEAYHSYFDNETRIKTGSTYCWWLRSALTSAGNGAGSVHSDGHVCNNSLKNVYVGVSPAFNMDLSKVLFVSACGKNKSLDLIEPGAKVNDSISRRWKFTLLDMDKTVKITEGQTVIKKTADNDAVITVPYTYTGNDVTQISVMFTDKAYQDSGAQVLYYGALQDITDADSDGIPDTAGKGTFALPQEYADKNCGTDYFVYIIAEDVNRARYTDYASTPAQIKIP